MQYRWGIPTWALVWFALATAGAAAEGPDHWVRELSHRLAGHRARAAEALGRAGPAAETAVGPLIDRLQDPDDTVRLEAAQALAAIGRRPVRCITALLPMLEDPDEHLRYAAEWSVAKLAEAALEDSAQSNEHDLAELRKVLQQAEEAMRRRLAVPAHRARIEAVLAALPPLVVQPAPQSSGGSVTAVPSAPSLPSRVRVRTSVPAGVLISPATALPGASQSAGSAKEEDQVRQLLQTGNRFVQIQLLERLWQRGSEAEGLLRVALDQLEQDGDLYLLHYAAGRWSAGDAALVNRLLAGLPRDGSPLPDWSITLLSHARPTGPEEARRMAELAQQSLLDPSVRSAALSALGRGGANAEEEIPRLAALLENVHEPAEVRAAAAKALGELGAASAAALPELVRRTLDDADVAEVRSAAAEALPRIDPDSLSSVRAVRLLIAEAADWDRWSRAELIRLLGEYGAAAEGAVPELAMLLAGEDEVARHAAAEALGQIGAAAAPAAPELVARLLAPDENTAVKAAAAAGLAAIGPEAVEQLALPWRDADEGVRGTLARACAAMGPRAAPLLPLLLEQLRSAEWSPQVRAATATALGELGSEAAAASGDLEQLVRDATQDDELRAMAAIALARIAPSAEVALQELAQEADPELQLAAGFALHLAGDTSAGLPLMMRVLADENLGELAEQAIADCGSSATPVLLQTLHDQGQPTAFRLACLRVLVRMELADVRPLLLALNDSRLADEARWYLPDLGNRLIPELVSAEQDALHYTAAAREQMRQIVETISLGLGGGDDHGAWGGRYALTRPHEATASPPAGGGMPLQAMEAPSAAPPAEPRPAVTAMAPTHPEAVPRARGGAAEPAGGEVASPRHRQVRVFYGTNRQRIAASIGPEGSMPLALTVLAICSLTALVLAAFAYLRRRQALAPFAVAGCSAALLVGLGILAASWSWEGAKPRPRYAAAHSPRIELGMCQVTLPYTHRPGEVERPSILRLEFREDADRHVVLQRVQHLEPEQFYFQLDNEMTRRGRHLLVFVHGYNVSFDDAARRTAQMAADLKFPGAAVFFSWPSQADWYRYRTDKKNIELSIDQLKTFLTDIARRSDADSINLIAHSMGTVGLTGALKEMQAEADQRQQLFNQVILAAPDIDADIFRQRIAPSIVTKAKRVTLYASNSDLALIASRYFNAGRRAGDAGDQILLVDGIETVDVSAVDSSLLGHSYYGSNLTVLSDIAQLLLDRGPAQRSFLREAHAGQATYWVFDPTRLAALPEQ